MAKLTFMTDLNQRRKTQTNHMSEVLSFLNTTRTRIILISTIIILGLSYLWLVNSSATAGFYLSDLEGTVFTLEEDYNKYELEKTALQSLDHIQEMSADTDMIASGRVEYDSGATTVALRAGQ